MDRTATERLAAEQPSPKVTTADINRFSRGFVGSLKEDGFPQHSIQNLLAEFDAELPSFIHHASMGTPKTTEDFQRRVETVRKTVLDRRDVHEHDVEPFIEKAFQAGLTALNTKEVKPLAASNELTLESVASFATVLISRTKKSMPQTQVKATEILSVLTRRLPPMIGLDGDLPETVDDMKKLIGEKKDNVIARLQKSYPGSTDNFNGAFEMALASLSRPAIGSAVRTY